MKFNPPVLRISDWEIEVRCSAPLRGYGIAYRDFCDSRTVYAIIPLNLIIRNLRRFWLWAYFPGYDSRERRILSQQHLREDAAYERGCQRGWQEGFSAGMGTPKSSTPPERRR